MKDPHQYLRPPLPDMTRVRAFVTGSHAYGNPTEDSDIDLVIPGSVELHKYLKENITDDREAVRNESSDPFAILTGGIDIIIASTKEEYEFWRDGTMALIEQRPVSRKYAIDYFYGMRQQLNIRLGNTSED